MFFLIFVFKDYNVTRCTTPPRKYIKMVDYQYHYKIFNQAHQCILSTGVLLYRYWKSVLLHSSSRQLATDRNLKFCCLQCHPRVMEFLTDHVSLLTDSFHFGWGNHLISTAKTWKWTVFKACNKAFFALHKYTFIHLIRENPVDRHTPQFNHKTCKHYIANRKTEGGEKWEERRADQEEAEEGSKNLKRTRITTYTELSLMSKTASALKNEKKAEKDHISCNISEKNCT